MEGLTIMSVRPSLVPRPDTGKRWQTVTRQDMGALPKRVPGKKVTRKMI